jgi:hypothetical protein
MFGCRYVFELESLTTEEDSGLVTAKATNTTTNRHHASARLGVWGQSSIRMITSMSSFISQMLGTFLAVRVSWIKLSLNNSTHVDVLY